MNLKPQLASWEVSTFHGVYKSPDPLTPAQSCSALSDLASLPLNVSEGCLSLQLEGLSGMTFWNDLLYAPIPSILG